MHLQLATPTLADLDEINAIIVDSYGEDPVGKALCTNRSTAAFRNFTREILKSRWNQSVYRVAKDTDTNQIISVMRYTFVPADASNAWQRTPPEMDLSSIADMFNVDMNRKLSQTMFEQRGKHMGPRAHILVEQLGTRTDSWRQGGGTMLVQHLNTAADQYNLPVFLLSSAGGRSLYERAGFKVMENIEVDVSVINQPPAMNWAMVRPKPRPDEPSTVPARPLQPVQVVPVEATMEDCIAYEKCTEAAIGDSPVARLCFGGGGDDKQDQTEKTAAKVIEQVKNTKDFIVHKAIDPDTGEALGFSKWMVADDPHRKMYPFGAEPPPVRNPQLFNDFFQKAEDIREQYFRDRNEPYIYLATLMILPQAQRRGVGSALLRAGLAQSDARNIPAYINASPAGSGLYRKFGWNVECSVTINLKTYGGPDQEETMVGMLRPVNAKEEPRAAVAS